MHVSFSFCGTDINEIGLWYAPENQDTFVYKNADYNVHEQAYDGHNGGYFYGTTTQPKEFNLRCYFEDLFIKDGIIEKIEYMFRRGRQGKLVFSTRPFVYYDATVVNLNTDHITNYRNGFVQITMKAYYPFGRCENDIEITQDVKNASACIDTDILPAYIIATDSDPLTAQTTVLLYNGGTERADVAIELAGDVGEGVSIANKNTDQLARFVALKKTMTTNVGKYIVSDSMNGKTILRNISGTVSDLAFLYHDHGFISLEPAYPIIRDVHIVTESGSNIVSVNINTNSSMIGKYIYIGDAWQKIVNIGEHTITVNQNIDDDIEDDSPIVIMNEITITPSSTMNLTRLRFIYKPTFA